VILSADIVMPHHFSGISTAGRCSINKEMQKRKGIKVTAEVFSRQLSF